MKNTSKKKSDTGKKSIDIKERPSGFPTRLWLPIALLLGIIIYSNSFDCSFHLDDKNNIIENTSIRELSNPVKIWNESKLGKTRILPYLTFALNYQYGKLDVWGYHFVNLLIHLANTCLVFWVTLLVFSAPETKNHRLARYKHAMAAMVALLFVSHPLATQSVTYIVQRMASMAAMFYLLSVGLYIKARITESKRPVRFFLFAGCAASALMAMFSKENAFTLPLTLALIEIVLMRTIKLPEQLSGKRFPVLLTVLSSIAVFSALKIASSLFETIPPTGGNDFSITPLTYLLTQFPVILTYIRLLILPVNQNLDHDFPLSESLLEGSTLISLLLLLSIMALGIRLFKTNRILTLGIFWFFITLAIESSVVPIEDLIFEHRTYLPSFGFFIVITTAVFSLFWEKNRNAALAIFITLIGINSTLAYNRNEVWKNELSLWDDVVSKSPEKARGYLNRGVAYWDKGSRDKALADYSKAVSLSPGNYFQAHLNLAVAYESFSQWDMAIDNYQKAISINPKNPEAHNGLGISSSNNRMTEQAIAEFTTAISLNPNDPRYYFNRGNTYMNNRQWTEAERDFTVALTKNPKFTDAIINRATVYGMSGQSDKAIADCSSALAIDPNSAKALFNRAVTYFNSRKWSEAIVDYTDLLRLVPNQKDAYYNRGIAYLNTGNEEAAISDFSKVLELDPNNQAAFASRQTAVAALEKSRNK